MNTYLYNLMKVLKSSILFLLLSVLGSYSALFAQSRMVSGKVLDTQQEPLAGVTIRVEGTTQGGITAEDGSFKLQTPSGTVILEFSYVGCQTQKVKVTPGQKDITVHMQEDAVLLDEAVVVGYGTQKKVNLTGAVSTVGSKTLENRVSHSITNMLQGSVAGLNITTSSGVPGSSPAINVRGVTSINGAEPLILVDGAVGDLNRVNPNDVESISVIKDASAAAVYGARAAFGVILVTTKSGTEQSGKATVRYSGRIGWEAPTTSTDYEDTGYWSVYTINKFWKADSGTLYVNYTDRDMQQLLARVNDKTENPDRPWVVEEERNGRKQWVYYGNYDWWHMQYRDNHPVQQHNISISGGTKDIKYLVSGAYDYQKGILKANPDIYRKYNLRAKIDFRINKWTTMTNNTSFYGSQYSYQGDGSVENTLAYGARHALACFPMQNPDGSWLYSTPYLNYKVGNGRHIILGEGSHRNVERANDFSNTTRLVIKPIKALSLTADFTYRLYQARNTSRSNNMYYREYPDAELGVYATGAGANRLDEAVNTRNYYSTNAYANFEETFNGVHHLSAVAGFNYETLRRKNVSAYGEFLSSTTLDDLDLVGQNSEGQTITGVGGGQNEYALMGFFGRINYDYKARYLFEVSGRYDGTSRFARNSRWGLFPSGSVGWRISEEPFFKPARKVIDNLRTKGYELSIAWRDKLSLGHQPLEYSIGFNVSDYKSYITKYDNKDKTFAKSYYEGMRLGEIWGFVTDGLFQSTEEAQAYAKEVDLSYINKRITGGWQGGDLKFVDLDGDGILDIGGNSANDPGDRKVLGNSLPSFSYGINASVRWAGFDASVFFQGTGNHYWYPTGQAMQFWGPYSYPYLTYLQEDFLKDVWAEDNKDAYFTRPMAYSATSGPLSKVNDRYLQNLRYLRFKNLTVGYTVPATLTKKIGVDLVRVYFSGENLCYWSPLKKHTKYIDPEAAIDRDSAYNNAYYPWQKTFMFGIDITF